MAVQSVMAGEELSSGTAFVMLSQAFGPTVTLTLYNVLFDTSLRSEISTHAPNVNATAIINAGATESRAFVEPTDLPSVLVAYARSLDRVFYLVAGLAAAYAIFLWGMGWHDMRRKGGGSKAEGRGTATSQTVEDGKIKA